MLHLLLVASVACHLTTNDAVAKLKADGVQVIELTPAQVLTVETNFNADPPVTHYHFDRIVVVPLPNQRDPFVILSINGCVADAERVPADVFMHLMEPHARGI